MRRTVEDKTVWSTVWVAVVLLPSFERVLVPSFLDALNFLANKFTTT